MSERHFEARSEGDVTVIQLLDPRLFDTLLISELQDELIEFLEAEQPNQVLVDFDGVTHCSTSVINALLRAKKRIISTGGKLKMCSMTPQIREAYRMLNLDGTVFEIHDSHDEAMRSW